MTEQEWNEIPQVQPQKWISIEQEKIYRELERLMAFRTYEDLNEEEKSEFKELQERFENEWTKHQHSLYDLFSERVKDMAKFLENNPIPQTPANLDISLEKFNDRAKEIGMGLEEETYEQNYYMKITHIDNVSAVLVLRQLKDKLEGTDVTNLTLELVDDLIKEYEQLQQNKQQQYGM